MAGMMPAGASLNDIALAAPGALALRRLANLIARVVYAVGGWLRNVQTGYIRSYVLFLVLAAVGLFAALTYFVSLAAAK